MISERRLEASRKTDMRLAALRKMASNTREVSPPKREEALKEIERILKKRDELKKKRTTPTLRFKKTARLDPSQVEDLRPRVGKTTPSGIR